jgi:hypothetical protein
MEKHTDPLTERQTDNVTPDAPSMPCMAMVRDGRGKLGLRAAHDHLLATGPDCNDAWPSDDLTPEGDEGDEGDLVPAPGCGHPMPPGVDCCVSTQAAAEVPVCLAASRHGGICGQPMPCDGSRHVEPAPAVTERRTVSLEVLTDELRALAAQEYVGANAVLLADAKVGIVGRIDERADAVTDVDTDWIGSGAEVFASLMRQAQGRAEGSGAELLMPTPDVLAGLDGHPDATFWTAPVPVRAEDVQKGWISYGYSGPGVEEPITMKNKECKDPACPWPGDCTALTIGADPKPQHFADWTLLDVRIPAAVAR